jgi:MoxR-like ATPase
MTTTEVAQSIDQFRERFGRITREMARRIVGHDEIVTGAITSLLAGGHVLLEGIPGIGKTSLVHTLADVLHLQFSRIQFTPDLMPADIVGTNIVQEHAHGGTFFEFQPGPIFANVVLADEINRATPKTQSALLEAMQDMSVSVGKTTYRLEQPFLVLATQNPLEMEGTYPLPEAQLDRFFFKLKVAYPSEAAMHEILDRTTAKPTSRWSASSTGPRSWRCAGSCAPCRSRGRCRLRDPADARLASDLALRDAARQALRALRRQPARGAGARARGKIQALNRGHAFVSIDDIRSVALPALRHRILLNFEGEADEVDTDAIVTELLGSVATE